MSMTLLEKQCICQLRNQAEDLDDRVDELEEGSGLVTKITDVNYIVGTDNDKELQGGVIYVTGEATITLPPVSEGASFTIITIGDLAVSVDPNAADLIYLNGVIQADGEKISNDSTTGDMAVFTYYNATGWVAMTSPGWTNGG
jgi:hypothetical protein